MIPPDAYERRAPAARVYDRVARIYDLMEAPMNLMGGTKRRRRVLSGTRGEVLEVGIGTGLNLEHYSVGIDLVGIDISGKMLRRAQGRAERLGRTVIIWRVSKSLSVVVQRFRLRCIFSSR
jgi:ubiquinone/menaquinone biosynthesis C-methylase UbiE